MEHRVTALFVFVLCFFVLFAACLVGFLWKGGTSTLHPYDTLR